MKQTSSYEYVVGGLMNSVVTDIINTIIIYLKAA